MNKQQQQSLVSFRRVIAFVDARPELTPDTTEGRALIARIQALRNVADVVESAASRQHSAQTNSRASATGEPELRRQLVEVHLASIRHVARGLSGSVPGISTALKVPNKRVRTMTLLERADAFAQQAQIYQEMLVEHGLPSNAVGQLQSATAALRASVNRRESSRVDREKSTHQITSEIALGRSIVQGLTGVMTRLLDGKQDDMAAWRLAVRVRGSSPAMQPAVPADEGPTQVHNPPVPVVLAGSTSVNRAA